MDQPVYASGYGIRLIHQNPDEQAQQQQQQAQAQTNFIMTSHQDNNQILIADESTGQNIPVQHLQNNQYIQQQNDGSQYLIQNQSQAPQQVFYTNIPQQTQMKVKIIFILIFKLIFYFSARCYSSTPKSSDSSADT